VGQPVAYLEIISPDHERAQRFYGELFGWQVTVNPSLGGYGRVDTGAGDAAIGCGIGPSTTSSDAGVRFYVRVPDLSAALAQAEQLGATRLAEPADLPGGNGRFAMFADPDGNSVGLWT